MNNDFLIEEENREIKTENFNSVKDVLEEINKILEQPISTDKDDISLYDLAALIIDIKEQFQKIIDDLKSEINNDLQILYLPEINIINNNEIRLSLGIFGDGTIDIYLFGKDNEWFLDSSMSSRKATTYVGFINKHLRKFLNNFRKFSDLQLWEDEQYDLSLNCNNTNLKTKLSVNKLSINTGINDHDKLLDVGIDFNQRNSQFVYENPALVIIECLSNQEEELFKRTFVKIADCPLWLQDQLQEFRNYQLANPKKIETKTESIIVKESEIEEERQVSNKKKPRFKDRFKRH